MFIVVNVRVDFYTNYMICVETWMPNPLMVNYLNSKTRLLKWFYNFLICFIRICIQSLEKVLIRAKNIFVSKFNISIPLKKFLKMHTNMHFFTFIHVLLVIFCALC
jgi:hypothetical protein